MAREAGGEPEQSRSTKGEQTRTAIVEAALRLFRENGYEATTMRSIAREAGVATGNAAIALYAEVIDGARVRVPAILRDKLPELLWLYSLGIVLYWVHDTSPGCTKTYRLIDATAPLAQRVVKLAWFPLFRPLLRQLLAVTGELRA
jgi:AcrR family transcriptional regulator